MVQAAVSDGEFFDISSPFNDDGVASEVGIARRDVNKLKSTKWG